VTFKGKPYRRLVFAWNLLAPLLALVLWMAGQGWWGLALLASAHALWFVPTLWPQCDWCGEVMTKLPDVEGAKQVWLTIDDGPDEQDTPLLLNLLDEYGVKSTFFFIAAKAGLHPELVEAVTQRGHAVGNHTLTHPQYWFWAYGPSSVKRQILWSQRVLTDVSGGVAPRWFRAPAGFKNPWVHEVLERSGLRYAGWNARGLDGVHAYKDAVLARLKKQIQPGCIILMHEARVDAAGQRLAPQVLAELLRWLKQEGYTCVLPS
jgi:peptidoglycan-N-acetylglucosamine deacetylase